MRFPKAEIPKRTIIVDLVGKCHQIVYFGGSGTRKIEEKIGANTRGFGICNDPSPPSRRDAW